VRCKDVGELNFGTPPPTCVTVAWFHEKFEADGTVESVDIECSEDLTI
jgi:hypothetical protein